MIILEGSDRTGKTTVAEALMKLLPGWAFSHQTRPPEGVDWIKYGGWRLMGGHSRVVWDRCHWSDYAYGKAYARGMNLTPHQWRLIELAFLSRGAVVVLMHDSEENIRGRWSAEEMYAPDQLGELLGHYISLIGHATEGVVSYLPAVAHTLPDLIDLETGEPTHVLHNLADYSERVASVLASNLPPQLGFGSPTPSFMIVGEAMNERCKPCGDLPRFPLDIGPAAEWMWRALDESRVRWWEGYYTNANAFRGAGEFAAYVNRLHPQRVLALGNVAKDLLVEASAREGLSHEIGIWHAAHPMFVRRFQHDDFEPWRTDVAEALQPFCGPQTLGEGEPCTP